MRSPATFVPSPPQILTSSPKIYPISPKANILNSLLYMHHFPVLEKGVEEWGVTVIPPPILFSFSHSNTSYGQCNCYNRSCLWRRRRRRLHFPWSTPLEWWNTIALLFTADTSIIQTTVHWRQFLSPSKYLNSWAWFYISFCFSKGLSWGSCS